MDADPVRLLISDAESPQVSETFWQRLRKQVASIFRTRLRTLTPHEAELRDRLAMADSLVESLQKQQRDLLREREDLQGQVLLRDKRIGELVEWIGTIRQQREADALVDARRMAMARAWFEQLK